MSRDARREGRVALVDFYLGHPPEGWFDWSVYVLGLSEYQCVPAPEDASLAVREAHTYLFPGYGGSHSSHPYPHIVALRPEPLYAILTNISMVRGIDGFADMSGKSVRLTIAKVSDDETRAILVSGDSRGYWPTLDPHDINWDRVHYDEKILTVEDYRRIITADEHAFLKALGVRIPGKKPAV